MARRNRNGVAMRGVALLAMLTVPVLLPAVLGVITLEEGNVESKNRTG